MKESMQIILTEDGYITDGGTLSAEDLYNTAFDGEQPEDAALRFLSGIARLLIDSVRRDPDIELTRHAAGLDPQSGLEQLKKLPYVLGSEFVSLQWISRLYDRLADVFNAELHAFKGTAGEYLQSKNAALTVSGRVFFIWCRRGKRSTPLLSWRPIQQKRMGMCSTCRSSALCWSLPAIRRRC